ncbi:MAG: HEAT repeat domain-containing protein [Sandaracinaceae bacterium]
MRASIAIALLWLTPVTAWALPLPLQAPTELGDPARTVTVSVTANENVGEPEEADAVQRDAGGATLTVQLGARSASETLAVPEAEDAVVEVVPLAEGPAALVRVRGSREVTALVVVRRGAPRIVWTGRTDLHGDPGERTAQVVTIDDRTGDGHPNVVVGMRREGVRLCDDTPLLLYPRAYDPNTGEMRPVTLPRVRAQADDPVVTATRTPPVETDTAPLVRALGAIGASSTSGVEEGPGGMAPPRSLTDGNPASVWAEGRGGPGAQELVLFRRGSSMPVRAVALTLSPTENAALFGRPQEFWLVTDTGRIRVIVPEDPAATPGARWWVVPPEPIETRCMAVVLDSAYTPERVRDAAVHTGMAEVEVYTQLDFGGGVEALVGTLIEGGDGGDEATRLLGTLGQDAVDALMPAWDRLGTMGRRRAVRVFATTVRQGVDASHDGLGRASLDEDDDVRRSALAALGTLGPRAGAMLAELVSEAGPTGDDAIRPLLRHPASIAVPGLLAAVSAEGGSERPALREGLSRSLARAEDAERARLSEWLEATPSPAALAAVALALADYGPTRPLAGPAVTRATTRVESFEDRWRTIRAARSLRSDGAVDGWLATQARLAEEWMIRAAAIEALGRRGSDRREGAARRALEDDYPRVRVAAIEVLDQVDGTDRELAERAVRDSWPMVREAAISALWDRPEARRVVRRGIRDRSALVRRASIRAAIRAGDEEAWPLVRARLMDDDEWPQVSVAGLRFVRTFCIQEAAETLMTVIERGLEPDPWAPDLDVAAVAVDLALRLGSDIAAQVVARVDRPEAEAALRAALTRGREHAGQCPGDD